MQALTNFQKTSMQKLSKIIGIDHKVRKDDKGLVTGVSIHSLDGKFYLSATHGRRRDFTNEIVEWWFFDEPSTLPAACKAHHFTLRKQIHQALNHVVRKAK